MNEQIEKYFLGELTTAQKDDLFKQMDGKPDICNEFTCVQNSWALAVSTSTSSDKYKARKYLQEFKKRQNRKRALAIFIGLTKYAAVFVIGMLIARGILHQPQAIEKPVIAYQTLTVPAGHRAHLTLTDGTTVWVNAQSTLEYPGFFSGEKRELTLIGEAYFNVAANTAQPFIVKSGIFRTQVTGTQFNVFAYHDFYEVSLVEGQVKVYETGTVKDTVVLNRNERVVLTDGKLEKKVLTNMDDLLWKEGIFSFDNELLADIIIKLEFFYGKKITVLNPDILKVRYTGKFNQNDRIDEILRIFQKIKKFNIYKDAENNFILK